MQYTEGEKVITVRLDDVDELEYIWKKRRTFSSSSSRTTTTTTTTSTNNTSSSVIASRRGSSLLEEPGRNSSRKKTSQTLHGRSPEFERRSREIDEADDAMSN